MNNLFPLGKHNLSVDNMSLPIEGPRMKVYADRLRRLLEEETGRAGLSEAQIARDIAVHERALNQWKNRGSLPRDPAQLHRLCERLRTHPNYLLGWDTERYPHEDTSRLREVESELRQLRAEVQGLRHQRR